MTNKQLNNIRKLIVAAEDDCDCVSVQELTELKVAVERELTKQSMQHFLDYLNSLDFPCDKDWTIMLGSECTTVPNRAEVLDGMKTLIADAINDM